MFNENILVAIGSHQEIILTLFFRWQSAESSNYQACTVSTAR